MNGRRGAAASAIIFIALATLVAGCGERQVEEHRVWTLFDFQDALEAIELSGGDATKGLVAGGKTLGPGMPATMLLDRKTDGTLTLKVGAAFAEGKPAAFVTTELWINYRDNVWLQPLYAQLVALGNPPQFLSYTDGRQALRIIDVGPKSPFYSPFWQVNAAVVGNVDAEAFRSSRGLLSADVPIQPLGTRTCPLRPLDPTNPVNLAGGPLTLPGPWEAWHNPPFNIQLQPIPAGETWFENEGVIEKLGLFDFGPNLFDVVDMGRLGGVIEPLPFFVMVASDADGNLSPLLGEPRVGAVGPLFSGRPADVGYTAAGLPQPRFGAYWRVFLAIMPSTAGPFHAMPSNQAAADAAMARGIDPLEYEGRMALDQSCFVDGIANFPDSCVWLDSQAKIESLLGASNIVPTEITGTCPFVLYDKLPVAR